MGQLRDVSAEVVGMALWLCAHAARHGVPLFGSQKRLAPAMPATYIDYRLERGTFAALMQKDAMSFDGLSVPVGRYHDRRYPDQLRVRVQTPPEAKQFTVVLAWKDRDE
jgi:hypothetical protein